MSRGGWSDLTGDGRRADFKPRLGRVRRDHPGGFIGKVNKAVAKARAASGRMTRAKPSGRFNARGRGAKIAPGLKGHGAWTVEGGMRFRARRVIVKARVVKLAGAGSRAAYAHLRYLQREGAGLGRAETPERESSAPGFAEASETAAKRTNGLEIAAPLERAESAVLAAPEIEREAGRANDLSSLAADSERAARDGVEVDRDAAAPDAGGDRDRDRDRGALYSSFTDEADARAFLKRGEKDRHQFRFIVSPEDGAELGDPGSGSGAGLRPFTRGLMRELERDLGTRLDWVAVDHYDTGHPHAHIVVRGATDDGKILNIAGDYIAHGIRARASERLTLELGPQSEWEVVRKLGREATADRFTRLDRELHRLAENSPENIIDLRPGRALEQTARLRINKHLLIARARHLESLALAEKQRPGVWTLSPDAEATLRRLGERGDIVKAMHRAMAREGIAHARHVSYDQSPAAPTPARIIGKELSDDELSGDIRLIVDGADGLVRSVDVGAATEAAEARIGAVVEIGPPRLKPADETIAEIARDNAGVYDPQPHAMQLAERSGVDEARDLALAHIRRLEALRRARIVERREDGRWTIPEDFAEKALDHDARGGRQSAVRMLSALSLEAQVNSDGATWLDRTLVKGDPGPADALGFGGEVARALHARQEKLIAEGLAERVAGPEGGMVRYRRNLLTVLARRELLRVGEELAEKTGKDFAFPEDGARIRGTYRGALQLASGKYALVERSREFTLVPWRPLIEKELGREVAGIMRGGGVSWTLGRSRDLGIGR